jgi:hypothetical protein
MSGDSNPPAGAARRLARAQTLWMATTRPSGDPHLVPIWFVWDSSAIFVCTAPNSVKAVNLRRHPRVVVALEDGMHPLICEGEAQTVRRPWPPEILVLFRRKYDWKIDEDSEYTRLIRIRPRRWLTW